VRKWFWCGHLKGRDHEEDLGVDGTIIMKRILSKWDGNACIGLIWLRIGTSCGLVNKVMNLLAPKSAMNILNKLRSDLIFKKGFAPWS
jgi:hypothetical protein